MSSRQVIVVLGLVCLVFISCGRDTDESSALSSVATADLRDDAPVVPHGAEVLNYFRLASNDGERFLRFIVDEEEGTAFVYTNEHAYAGRYPMRFIANVTTTWPLVRGQIIPMQWHVGSTTGDCYFSSTLEVKYIRSDKSRFSGAWTIPAYVSAACASQGQRSFDRDYQLGK